MSGFFIVLILIVVAALAVLFLKTKFTSQQKTEELPSDEFPFLKQEVFLSPAERSFFGVLEQAVGDSWLRDRPQMISKENRYI